MKGLFPWRLPLVGLIAINLFLTGLLVAPHFRPMRPPPVDRMAEHIVGEIVAVLDKDDAAVVRATFDRDRTELHTAAEQFRAARARIPVVLAAEPFDRGRLDATLDETALQGRAVEAALHRLLMDVAPAVSPDGRRRIAAFMAKKAP